MHIINVFLGSSINELEEERVIFGDIISELNSKLRKVGIIIYLHKCEYNNGFLGNTPTQSEINETICNCNYSYFIIKTKLGKYTEDEFDVALNSFIKKGNPKLSVLFCKCSEELTENAKKFQNRLQEMQYYYKQYRNKEELKLNVVLNIAVDDIILEKGLKVEDGGIYVGNERIVNIENIPVYSKHSELVRLNKQLEELETQEKCCEDKRGRRIIREKIHEIVTEIRRIENLIYRTMLGLTKATRGEITPLLKRAIVYIENGEIEKAAEILNPNDVIEELEEYEKRTKISIEGIKAAIDTTYIAIESMIQLPKSLNTSRDIEMLFEKIISLEIEYKLNRNYCGLYVRYLLNNKKYDYAEKYISLYLESDCVIETLEDFAEVEYSLLGMQITIEKLHKEQPKKYQNVYVRTAYNYICIYCEALKKFGQDYMNVNPYFLAIHCKNLINVLNNWIGEKDVIINRIESMLAMKIDMLKSAGLYNDDDRSTDGKEDAIKLLQYIEIKNECEKLNQEPTTDDPKEYLIQYAEKVKNLLEFIQDSNNMFMKNNQATQEITKDYEKIIKVLSEDDEDNIIIMYAQIKIEHAKDYEKVANFQFAKQAYGEARRKLQQIKEKTFLYSFFLCSAYIGLSMMSSYLDEYEDAEDVIEEGINFCKTLKREIPFEFMLAKMHTIYAMLCLNGGNGRIYDRIEKGLKHSKCSYQIYSENKSKLVETDKANYINLCHIYAMLLLECGKLQDALDILVQGIDTINLLEEEYVQANIGVINSTIVLALQLGVKTGKTEFVKEKLGKIYNIEVINKIIDEFCEG